MLFKRIPRHQATTRRALILVMHTIIKIGGQIVEIPPMWKDFSALQRKSNVKFVTSLDISPVFVIKRNKHLSRLEDQRLINYNQEQCMPNREPFAATLKVTVPVMILSACRSKCSAKKLV